MGEHKHKLKHLVKPDSVMISYAHGGTLENDTALSLLRTMDFDRRALKLIVDIGSKGGLYVDDNRDDTVDNFLKHPANCKWFMSIDTDIVWDPQQVYVLLEAAELGDYPVLAGMYFTFIEGAKIHPVWKQKTKEGIYAACTGVFSDAIQQIDGVGMGFTLIRRDVLWKMGEVYKKDRWRWFGRDETFFRGKPTPLGEDLAFCDRVRAIGFDTYGHAGVRVGHIKKIMLTDKLFMSTAATGVTGASEISYDHIIENEEAVAVEKVDAPKSVSL